MSKYLNPYTDFGFKKLFGEEANKDLLMDFLNQLLPSRHQIVDLQLRNTEQLPEISPARKAIFHILCTSTQGERFIVEMQKAKLDFFKDRSLFYITFPIQEQAKKGQWLFQLMPVYFIAILDFEYDEAEERRRFLREAALRDQDGALFSDKLHFRFLQMPLFDKKESELENHFDKWVYFLKHLENFDSIPEILNESPFRKAFQVAELANLSREQYITYERNLLDYWTTQAAFDTAINDGHKKGLREGREKGLREGHEKGLREGIEKGREEGEQQKTREIAAILKRKGVPSEQILEATGLPARILEQL